MTEAPESNPWPAMFDGLAHAYDQTGVPYFTTIARGLVEVIDPQPGQRVLELGSGRGAATFLLAEAVGPTGHVDALDLAPGMVRLLTEDLAASGLGNVSVALGDASDPRPPAPPYDVIASSLVIFFLPDPAAGLARWRPLLADGGRVGVTTFRPWSAAWLDLMAIADEYDPSGAGGTDDEDDAFATDAGVEDLLRGAGFSDVHTVGATHPVPFDDAGQWRTWSMGTFIRRLWVATPESSHAEIMERVTEVLDRHRDADGRVVLEVEVRYTLGRA